MPFLKRPLTPEERERAIQAITRYNQIFFTGKLVGEDFFGTFAKGGNPDLTDEEVMERWQTRDRVMKELIPDEYYRQHPEERENEQCEKKKKTKKSETIP
jgi:hypothetical protein